IVRRTGDGTIEVYFDDMKKPAMTAIDRNFTWGRVGIGSFDDTGEWRNVQVRGVRAEKSVSDQIVLVAGGDGRMQTPFGDEFDRAGNLYWVELNGHRLGRIDTKGMLTTIAGTGKKGNSGDNGPATEATFNGPHNLAATPDGTIYIADTWNNRVRKFDPK